MARKLMFSKKIGRMNRSFHRLSSGRKSALLAMVICLFVFPSVLFFSNKQLSVRAEEPITIPATFPNPAPETPQNFRIQVVQNSVTARWDITNPAGPLINDFRIEYRPQGSENWVVYEDGVSTYTMFTATLPGGMSQLNLEARVFSIGADGQLSGPSNIVQYTVGPTERPKPQRPTNFGVIVSSDNILAIWRPSTQPEGITIVDYRIEWKLQGTTDWTVYEDGVSTNNSVTVFLDTNGFPALHLVGRVRAVAANGEVSDPSLEFNYTLGHN